MDKVVLQHLGALFDNDFDLQALNKVDLVWVFVPPASGKTKPVVKGN